MYLYLRSIIPHNVNALTVSLTVAVIKLMSSPVLQLNKEIALPDILRIPKYDTAAISSGKMDFFYSGEQCPKMFLVYKKLFLHKLTRSCRCVVWPCQSKCERPSARGLHGSQCRAIYM